jgi:molecular chaperone GrpE
MRRIPITKTQSQSGGETPAQDETQVTPEASAPETLSEESTPAAAGPDNSTAGGESPDNADLRRQLEEKDAEIQRLQGEAQESRNQLLRALADIDNVRKRGQKDREEAAQFGSQGLLSDLLPVIDNLERAVAASESATVESLREGVNLTLRQFQETLKRHGVEPVPGAGEPFDAQLHEAIMRADPTEDHPAGTVVDEIRKGYTLRGRLLRPSLVKVAQDE